MASDSSPSYRRLAGTGYRQIVPGWAIVLLFFVIFIFALLLRGRRVQLWLGKDHLLLVEWDGSREYYKRFRYQDIQTLMIRKTDQGKVANALLGAATGILAAFAIAATDPAGRIILLIVGALFGLLLLINSLAGPTCECQLRTAVQVEDLPALNRLRHAQNALEKLRPLLTAAQGELTPEELQQHLAAPPAPEDAPPVIAQQWSQRPVEPIRHSEGKVHAILFWLLVADLPLTALDLAVEPAWLDSISVLLLCATVGFAIAAIINQRNTDLPRALRRFPWITLGLTGVFLVTAIAYGIALVVNHPEMFGDDVSPFDDPVILVMTVISTATSFGLGALGLLFLKRFRAGSPTESPPPAAQEFGA